MAVEIDVAGTFITAADLTPAGTIVAYGGTTGPSGWLICHGSAVSRTTYVDLFTVIGEIFGQGDNSTTFNVPDFRGRFLRGIDDGEGTDPDAAGRTAMATGGNTGDNVGSIQTDGFQGHNRRIVFNDFDSNGIITAAMNAATTHTVAVFNSSPTASGLVTQPGTYLADGSNGTPRVSSETRPTNAYVNYIIKT